MPTPNPYASQSINSANPLQGDGILSDHRLLGCLMSQDYVSQQPAPIGIGRRGVGEPRKPAVFFVEGNERCIGQGTRLRRLTGKSAYRDVQS